MTRRLDKRWCVALVRQCQYTPTTCFNEEMSKTVPDLSATPLSSLLLRLFQVPGHPQEPRQPSNQPLGPQRSSWLSHHLHRPCTPRHRPNLLLQPRGAISGLPHQQVRWPPQVSLPRLLPLPRHPLGHMELMYQ